MIFSRPMTSLSHGLRYSHGRSIKWTLHIGFLTLAGMDSIIEGNHGKNSKKRVTRILCLSQYGGI